MSCKHEQIRTWVFKDTEESAGMWSCVKCGLKFEPINQRKPLTDEQILAGAQALCQQMAEACNVNPGDQWTLYADTFKEDAKAVLTAAAKLREKNS